jgi:hypothetical protein
MTQWDDRVNHHARELTELTMKVADQGAESLPENELARLGQVIATERQLLIDAMADLLENDEPDAADSPGVAEFDAGFVYGMAFAKAIDDNRTALDRIRRGRILTLVRKGEPGIARDDV